MVKKIDDINHQINQNLIKLIKWKKPTRMDIDPKYTKHKRPKLLADRHVQQSSSTKKSTVQIATKAATDITYQTTHQSRNPIRD